MTTEQEFDPVKPGTFEREKVDLNCMIYRTGARLTQPEWAEVYGWLEEQLTRHRAQAYAHGVEAGRRQRRYNLGATIADLCSGLVPALLVVALILVVVL